MGKFRSKTKDAIKASSNAGQSTVEYAVIFAGFLALIIGLEHALQSASHHLQQVAEGAWLDVFLY